MQGLELLYTAIEKRLSGILLQPTEGEVCFEELGQLLANKLKDKDWGVRDSALKVVAEVAKSATTKGKIVFCHLEMLLKRLWDCAKKS